MPKPPSEVAERARALFARKAENDERLGALRRQGATSSAGDFLGALVEGAFLVAAADGELDSNEAATLAETVAHVTGASLAPEEFMALIDRFAEALARDGLRARFAALASSLPDADSRREVVAFAALVGFCDSGLAPAEGATLAELAAALGLPIEQTRAVVNETRGALAGG